MRAQTDTHKHRRTYSKHLIHTCLFLSYFEISRNENLFDVILTFDVMIFDDFLLLDHHVIQNRTPATKLESVTKTNVRRVNMMSHVIGCKTKHKKCPKLSTGDC